MCFWKINHELREMLEFGQRIVIHNSKKSAVHEAGTEYRNGLTTSIYNHATKSVYRLNYLSKEIHIYNSDKGVLHKDEIRVVRDIVKVLAEEKSHAVMLHAAALYKKEYGGIILKDVEKRVCLWNFYINMVSQKYQGIVLC